MLVYSSVASEESILSLLFLIISVQPISHRFCRIEYHTSRDLVSGTLSFLQPRLLLSTSSGFFLDINDTFRILPLILATVRAISTIWIMKAWLFRLIFISMTGLMKLGLCVHSCFLLSGWRINELDLSDCRLDSSDVGRIVGFLTSLY